MTRLAFAAAALLVAGAAFAQAPAGTVEVTADGCKLYLPQGEARGASRIRWSGKCTDGFADGRGVVRIYSSGKISRVSEATFAAGKLTSPGEAYFVRSGEAFRSRGGDNLQIASSELPTWALELSMLVEDKPVRAPSRPAPPVAKPVEQPRAATEDAKKAEAQRQAETQRQQAEAQRQQTEAQKRQAEAKVAGDKLTAERATQEAERKRLQAERDRALAEAKAANERAAAAEKRAAERAAQDADRQRALADAKAATERAAAAEKLAAEKAAQEAARQRDQAEKERALAEAKAAADRAAAEQKLAAEKAAAAVVAAAAPPPPPKPAAMLFSPGRGFGEASGPGGAPVRGVVIFKLTTAEGRDLGVATFVAGRDAADLRQNAEALAATYERTSPFKAKLLSAAELGPTCNGPGYVVEARVTYPSAKSYGWYAGCMGDNLEDAAKRMQELESQLHRDYKVSATSFWAYQYLIVGYVDDRSFRGRDQYDRVAQSGMMAPGRVMVLSSAQQWAECTGVVNKDPKLKDKVACLREAVDKLKTTLGLR